MPISAAARAMRMAISPRFAIRSVFMVIGAILTPRSLLCRTAGRRPDARSARCRMYRREERPVQGTIQSDADMARRDAAGQSASDPELKAMFVGGIAAAKADGT